MVSVVQEIDDVIEVPGADIAEKILSAVKEFLEENKEEFGIESIEVVEKMDSPNELLVKARGGEDDE